MWSGDIRGRIDLNIDRSVELYADCEVPDIDEGVAVDASDSSRQVRPGQARQVRRDHAVDGQANGLSDLHRRGGWHVHEHSAGGGVDPAGGELPTAGQVLNADAGRRGVPPVDSTVSM